MKLKEIFCNKNIEANKGTHNLLLFYIEQSFLHKN